MRKRLGLVLNVGLWTLYGTFMTVQVVYDASLGTHPISWTRGLLGQLSYAYVWALVTPLIMRFATSFPLVSRKWVRNSVLHLFTGLLCALLTITVWDMVLMPLLGLRSVTTFERVWRELTWALDFGLLNYCLVLACHVAIHYYDRYRLGELRASQLQSRLIRSQLDALKMQLEPHFLFNTLHSIAELLHGEPEIAEQMLFRLSEFLRLTLDQAAHSEVTLNEELYFLDQYLSIQKLRFEERLCVEMHIDPDTSGAMLPNLILQPLVENAFKHGVSRCAGTAMLRIRSERRDDKLTVAVCNSCPPSRFDLPEKVEKGVGLTNTEERLRYLYGANSGVHIESGDRGRFEVTIEIPYRCEPDSQLLETVESVG